jgi:DNA-binding NtrC family response regulator
VALRQRILAAGQCDATLLIRGETGTGKDLIARLVHEQSARSAAGQFCKVNCPSIPEGLFESEMFGFEKGAFTGAARQRPGFFEIASGGTIFLDEIGIVPLAIQSKLLEVIEDKSFYRVGGRDKLHVDTRIVAATNADLRAKAAAGEFREDLYYRLNILTIEAPPLRERGDDIDLLFAFHVQRSAKENKVAAPEVRPEVPERLRSYHWPGNVRELQAAAARYALSGGDIETAFATTGAAPPPRDAGKPKAAADKTVPLKEQERKAVLKALQTTGWNQTQAASLLGLSYSALRRRVKKYNLRKPEWKNEA